MSARSPTGRRAALAALAAGLLIAPAALAGAAGNGRPEFTRDFALGECTFATTGSNRFFILRPGHQIRLAGKEEGSVAEVTITVTNDTELVEGVLTRVVEERESVGGALEEVSRNCFALCTQTGDVYYFGEDVDEYEDGAVVGHGGAWRAGVNGARAGLMMPGTFLLGSRYYQEVAEGVAMDRGENTATGLTVDTPTGPLKGCVEVTETTLLEPRERSRKVYAPGIGMIVDDALTLAGFTPAP